MTKEQREYAKGWVRDPICKVIVNLVMEEAPVASPDDILKGALTQEGLAFQQAFLAGMKFALDRMLKYGYAPKQLASQVQPRHLKPDL